ncbi:hypothetical protein L6452_39033 [Arctium lappa]|uniref:Uncharacterized protein n=1 Tax=Arctium lappa TaxID=4217 RepID=A0ACB8XQP6_ARCLA|nr:hypothetical protein L6452_39033 [Arctium lappa]
MKESLIHKGALLKNTIDSSDFHRTDAAAAFQLRRPPAAAFLLRLLRQSDVALLHSATTTAAVFPLLQISWPP